MESALGYGAGTPFDFLAGGGEMGERIRALDWSQTPLGPADQWPQSLRTAVRIALNSRYPMFVWWGPQLTKFYNDAYIPILGARHPEALGMAASDIWREIWDVLGPQVEGVMQRGESTWNSQALLVMERNGYTEETYFTFSYSPIPNDDDGIGGVFCVCTEDTAQVLGQRRVLTLRELATAGSEGAGADEACQLAARALDGNRHDVPFALFYLLDAEGASARLSAATGLEPGTAMSPAVIEFGSGGEDPWDLAKSLSSDSESIRLESNIPPDRLPGGPWPESARSAAILRIEHSGSALPWGFIVAGVSPRRAFDDDYRGFLGLLANSVATAVSNAKAREEERNRSEALAELDRAKTTFFSNISHEFRTPLTLMLGPLEELLSRADGELPAADREHLRLVHRNGLRLLRLVNTLLDFSRLEAGRLEAIFEPTDLAAYTADLASAFRSAVEAAGLTFNVTTEPLGEMLYVDRSLWEKVVLNLLSNAFKFTLEGGIDVTLVRAGDAAQLTVRDTGVGIPEHELPRLFERFHRIQGQASRSHEGTGIGLALVEELVKLQGGSISVESEPGRGTAFTVKIPFGAAHLPPEKLRTSSENGRGVSGRTTTVVDEARQWEATLPPSRPDGEPEQLLGRVLLVDDNSDMREYVHGLLVREFEVFTARDGIEALELLRREPIDLVLTDVMMPRLDGIGLLKLIREDRRLVGLPVILLSARAGEEAEVEGIRAGADDYLVKPFSALELTTRVRAHLTLSLGRREAQERVSAILESMGDAFFHLDSEYRVTFVNENQERLTRTRRADTLGRHYGEVWPEAAEPGNAFELEFRRVMESRVPVHFTEFFEPLDRWLEADVYPTPDGGISVFYRDVTEAVRAREAARASEERLALALAIAQIGTFDIDLRTDQVHVNDRGREIYGWSPEQSLTFSFVQSHFHDDDRAWVVQRVGEAMAPEGSGEFEVEQRIVRTDGEVRWIRVRGRGVGSSRAERGERTRCVGTYVDITEARVAEDALRESEARYRELSEELEVRVDERTAELKAAITELEGFTYSVSHDLRAPLRNIIGRANLLAEDLGADLTPEVMAHLTKIEGSAKKLGYLVDDLLEYSRLGRREIVRHDVNLSDLATRVVGALAPETAAKGSVEVQPGLHGQGDEQLLAMVLENLIENALKYSKPDVPNKVFVGREENVFFVRDSGIGFAMEYAERIFQPFERLHRAEGAYRGSGIGLANVRRIIERHGGQVWAESEPGKGSRFCFTLP